MFGPFGEFFSIGAGRMAPGELSSDRMARFLIDARSRYDYLINIVRLESASGGLQQDDLDAINGFLTQPTTLPAVRPKS